jgi:septal ring factor EnvC (AmiA/AmiB activator)
MTQRKTTRPTNGADRLEETIALLNQSVATLNNSMAAFNQNQALFNQQLAQTNERIARLEQANAERFARIEQLLIKHELMLQELPEAIRQKIGFQKKP